jgi:hypothetical protein
MAAVMTEIDRELSSRAPSLEEDLRFVDLLCNQWAREAQEGEGRRSNALYRVIREREGAGSPGPPPAMSDNALALDVILAKSDPRYRALVVVWYCEGGSIAIKAKRLHTNRTDLYALWRRTLEYLKGRLHGVGIDT